jgi:hypothetical protein
MGRKVSTFNDPAMRMERGMAWLLGERPRRKRRRRGERSSMVEMACGGAARGAKYIGASSWRS